MLEPGEELTVARRLREFWERRPAHDESSKTHRPAGRMIGTSAALLTTELTNIMPGKRASTQLAYDASAVALLVYAGGFVASFWLPEPQQDKLPD